MGGLASAMFENFGLVKQGIDLIQGTVSNEVKTGNAQDQQALALKQLQETQKLQQQQAAQNAALDRAEITAAAEADANERNRALRRAVARQRAKFGASGVSQGSGSSQAVLLGLFDETQEELDARERLDNLRNQGLDLDLSQQNSVNILQRQQLKESQKISDLSTLNRVNNAIDFTTGAIDLASKASKAGLF